MKKESKKVRKKERNHKKDNEKTSRGKYKTQQADFR